jgi:hypothetical protein
MTYLEIFLIVLFALIVVFLVYFFLRGSTGKVSITRPVESRIDEYLDRRFERIIEEWSLVRRPKLQKYKEERGEDLTHDEENIRMLKRFENDMKSNLTELEVRLNALEDTLAAKESGKR